MISPNLTDISISFPPWMIAWLLLGRGNPRHYVLADRFSGRILLQPHHPSSQHRLVQSQLPRHLADRQTAADHPVNRFAFEDLRKYRRVVPFLPSRKPGIGVHQIGGGSNVNEMPCVDL